MITTDAPNLPPALAEMAKMKDEDAQADKDAAQQIVECINSIPSNTQHDKIGGQLEPAFKKIIDLDAGAQDFYIDAICERFRLRRGVAKSLLAGTKKQKAQARMEMRREKALLERGDEAEVADAVLEDMRNRCAIGIVADEGKLWRWHDTYWVEVPEAEAHRRVLTYAGETVASDQFGFTSLKMSNAFVEGTAKLMYKKARRDNFFADAQAGVAFANGFLSVGAGGVVTLTEPSPDQRARFALPYAYDENARAPRFERFLEESLCVPEKAVPKPPDRDDGTDGDDGIQEDDDADGRYCAAGHAKIQLLQELAGAALVGCAPKYQRAVIMAGGGANGKSTFIYIISALISPEAVSAVPPQDWVGDYAVAGLVGKRLNVVGELPPRELLAGDRIKSIISGDRVKARHPYGRAFTFRPEAAHFFSVNDLPPVTDFSRGFWRRFSVVKWLREFAPHEQDSGLADYVIANEMPGVVAWAVEGARRLIERGRYHVAEVVDSAREEWRRDADVVAQWIDEQVGAEPPPCPPGFEEVLELLALLPAPPAAWVEARKAFNMFVLWAKASEYRPLGYNGFVKRLRALNMPVRPRGKYNVLSVGLAAEPKPAGCRSASS